MLKGPRFACTTALAVAIASVSVQIDAVETSWPTTEPFWPHYPGRSVQTLSGNWSFAFSTSVDPSTVSYADAGALLANGTQTQVQGSFYVAPAGILGPRGAALFSSSHYAVLKFYAVNFYARVFVDGLVVGNHTAGGYTPFQFVVGPCAATGVRQLLVATSNSDASTPLCPTCTGGDFYFYGGIIRPVVVTELKSPKLWIDRVEPVTKDIKLGLVDFRVVFGGTVIPSSVTLMLAFNGGAAGKPTTVPVVNASALLAGVPVPSFKLWTAGQGNLYTLQVTEMSSGDSLTIRSGVRMIGVDTDTGRLTINGQAVKLVGFNRHTMWPDTGAAVTPAQEAADLALLQKLNVNYVRGAHYPQSPSWLDLCDEAGIVIWEEALGPGVSVANTQDAAFMASHLQAMREMVTTSIAHPCVVLHGFFNEGPSNDQSACEDGYAPSAALVRALVGSPPTRFVTWASDKTTSDVCYSHADVISFNNYPGWYNKPGNVSFAAEYWAEQVAWIQQHWPQKPFTVSETGGGGIYEWTNDTSPDPGVFWSQKYQRHLVVADAQFLASASRVTGVTLWQFSDIKGNDGSTKSCGQCVYGPHPDTLAEPWDCIDVNNVACGRPKGENNKGVVDWWRRPKEDFNDVAAVYKAAQEL